MMQNTRRGPRWLGMVACGLLVALCVLAGVASAIHAQSVDPLAPELADKRVEAEENDFLVRSGQITAVEHRERARKIGLEIRALHGQIAKRGRAEAPQIHQQSESLFQVRIVPLREHWRQKLVEKQQSDQARDAALRTQALADADKAGKLQAARTIARERLQRSEISQDEFSRQDGAAEAEILALQRQYDGHGANWGRFFSGTVARIAQTATADLRLKARLADKTSEVGRDANRAAELTLSMQRNAVFRVRQAIGPQEEQRLNAALQSELGSIQGRYGAGVPAAADFKDRVGRLVQAGATAGRAQWDREATDARQASQARAAAPVPPPAQPQAPRAEAPARDAPTPAPGVPTPAPAPRAAVTPPRSTPATPAPARPGTVRPGTDRPQVARPPVPSRVAPPRQSSGPSAAWLSVLLLPLAGGVGYVLYRRRRGQASPRYTDVKESSPPQAPADVVRQPSVSEAAPAVPAAAPLPRGASGGFKEQAFAEQKAKYQARYNDAVDEMTEASVELGHRAGVLDGVRGNLSALSKAVRDRVEALIEARYASPVKLVVAAATLMPVYRLFRRGGILLKLIIGFGALTAVRQVGESIIAGDVVLVVVVYGLLVAGFFFLERRLQLKDPRGALHKNAEHLKGVALAYVYDDQVAQVEKGAARYHALRVSATGTGAEEITVADSAWGGIAPGTFFLVVGGMAVYRIDPQGYTLTSAGGDNTFMADYGTLLTEALGGQRAFADRTLPPLVEYGQVAWRRRRAAEAVPRLEKLVADVERLEKLWRDTYVSDKVFEFLLRRIDLFNVRDSATPPGILLYGYPGNGKTHLAQKIAASVSARLQQVDPTTLVSAESIRALWEEIRGKDPVVLFVEYAERAFARPGGENEGVGTREGTFAWVTEWAKLEPRQSRVWVVMTAPSEKDLHQSVVNQFGGSKIEVTAPDATGREMILRTACRENQLVGALPAWLVAATGGASVRELQDIVRETKLLSVPHPPTDGHWREAVKSVRGADAEFKDESKTWDRLVLPADIKEQLQRACRVLRDADRYKERGVNVPNVLLFGPPGTGKTDIARTFANEGGVKFLLASTADLKAEYVGQSAHLVQKVFAKARGMAPVVLFIDEIETVAAKRGAGQGDAFSQEIVTQMLQEMDGARRHDRPVFVLAATNRPEDVDPAILSRFTSKIEIPLPDEAGRQEMLNRLIGERPVDPALDVEEVSALLARRTARRSGRDLVMLVNRTMERAVMTADSPEDVRLTRELLLAEVAPRGREVSEAELKKVWAQIVLKSEVKESLLGKIRLFNRADRAAPRGLLLYGPPGTGKTEIARRIAESTSSHFMPLTGSDLKAGHIGGSGQYVRKVWDQARAHDRCVIFVDECEGVFARRGSVSTDSASEELVREFLAMWDGVGSEGQVWVVGATNRRDQLDEAIVSRFGAAVEIGLPEAAERMEILRLELRKLERETEVPELVGRATTGMAGRDLATVARDVCTMAAEQHASITPAMWQAVIARHAKASSESVDESARWDALILADATIEKLKTICETLRQVETLRKQGVEPPRGALLYGPPGTGKTQIARTLANESGLPFLAASTADIKAGFIGQSGQKVRELFERARGKAPCILFIDEIESVVPSRSGQQADQYTSEIVTQMLQELDGVKKSERHVFVLAATNHQQLVDGAILSRFEEKIEIPNPDAEGRRRLFRMFFAKQRRVNFDVDEMADEMARRAGEISGRDIQSLVRRAEQHAVQRAIRAGTADQLTFTREDLLAQLAPEGRKVSEADLQKVWVQIVLKPDVKESLLGKIRLFNRGDKAAPRGLLLYGPPGTGKTEIARRIAQSSSSHFLPLTGSDLKAGYVGQSGQSVRRVWDEARAYPRCVMFVDECEGVFARRGSVSTDSASEELVREFLAMWDGMGSKGQIWVVGATNRRDQLDEAIVSRFGAAVEIGLPEAAERMEILRLELRKLEREAEVPELVGRATTGMAGRDLATVARDVCTMAAEAGGAITSAMWAAVIARYAKASSETVDEDARWEALILAEDTIEKLKTICDTLRYVETLRKQGVEPPGGALLYGPPGTGKTQIARTLANESGLPFLAASTADIKAGFMGQSGQKVRELFERARGKAPCILFIDEIEAVAPSRGGAQADQYTNEIVTQMLQELDGVKKSERHVFVLAATNHRELVDGAVLSRFEEKIGIPNPDTEQRRRLFRMFFAKQHKVDFDVEQMAEELTQRCGEVSGRDIRSLVRRAEQHAVQRAIKAGTPDQVILGREDLLVQIKAGESNA